MYLKYRFWLLAFFSMASSEPMPLYFFSRTPSEKKYSPGASVVAARRDPIITADRKHLFHVNRHSFHFLNCYKCTITTITCRCPQRQCLHHMADRLDAPICDDWYPKPPSVLCHLVHGGALRPSTCHDYRDQKWTHIRLYDWLMRERNSATYNSEYITVYCVVKYRDAN